MNTLGKTLRRLRLQSDKQQQELADLLSIEQQTYSKFERDERTPKLEYLQKIAAFYKIHINDLLSDTPSSETDSKTIPHQNNAAVTNKERELYEKLLEAKDLQIKMMEELSKLKSSLEGNE